MSHHLEEGKTPAELRREREQRVMDAIHLKVPDRVPVICSLGYFVARYAGIPCSAAFYDYDAWFAAYRKTLGEFRPDMTFTQPFTPGKALEYLKPKTRRWPGYGLDPSYSHQSIEIDALKADEYDLLMNDPADYLFRLHLPRTNEGLRGLSLLHKLTDIGWLEPWAIERLSMLVTEPEIEKAIESLQKAGSEFRKWQPKMMEFDKMLEEFGLPQLFQAGALPPYDIVSHGVRGMKGTMMDMFRQPDKLREMCAFLLDKTLERSIGKPNEYGNLRIFMTNTRGSDDFLSHKQFDTFYWPTFKKLVLALIERGGTPCIFFEGTFTSKLEYLLEFPKGKVLVRLDATDIFRAKEILKGHLCIQGNVPSALLQIGSVQEVKDYCKKLIDGVGTDGGFILSPRSSTDEAKPENLKAMIEFTKEYGRY